MNRAIKRVATAVDRAAAAPRRPAHVPPGHRREEARRRPPQLAHLPPGLHPARAARSSAPTARSSPARSRATTSTSSSASTRTASCSPRPSATSRSSSAAPASRRSTTTCSRAGRRACSLRDLGDLLLGKEQTGNVVLSLRTDVQLVAKAALGDQQGSVVVTDPKTGAIIAMYSNPSFDPHAARRPQPEGRAGVLGRARRTTRRTALLPRAYRERYPPGSTFKIVTTEAALDTGIATPTTPFPTHPLVHAAAGRPRDPELRRRAAAAARSRRAS